MRLFLAYSIDENDKKKLLGNIKFLKKRYSNVRWIKEENLHLTIKFLGETDRKDDIINIINDSLSTGRGKSSCKNKTLYANINVIKRSKVIVIYFIQL